MRQAKRLVSLVLAAGMMASVLPAGAFASGGGTGIESAVTAQELDAQNDDSAALPTWQNSFMNADGTPNEQAMVSAGATYDSSTRLYTGLGWTYHTGGEQLSFTAVDPNAGVDAPCNYLNFGSQIFNCSIEISGITVTGGIFFGSNQFNGCIIEGGDYSQGSSSSFGRQAVTIKGGKFNEVTLNNTFDHQISGGVFNFLNIAFGVTVTGGTVKNWYGYGYSNSNESYDGYIYGGVFGKKPESVVGDEWLTKLNAYCNSYELKADDCTINKILAGSAYIASSTDAAHPTTNRVEISLDNGQASNWTVLLDGETTPISLEAWGATDVFGNGTSILTFIAPEATTSSKDVTIIASPVVKKNITLPAGVTNVTKTAQGSTTAEKVTLDSSNSAEVEVGATLAFTVSPDDDMDYTLESTDKTTNLVDNGNGSYSFTVPDADVTIKATPKKHKVTLPDADKIMSLQLPSNATKDPDSNVVYDVIKKDEISFKQPVDADVTYWYADGTELKPNENGVYTITVGTEDITIHTERNKHTVILPIHTCNLDTDNGFILPQGTAVFEDGSWIGDSYKVPGGSTIRFEKTEGADVTFWIVGRDAKTELKPDENGVYHLTVYTSDIKVVEEEIKEPDQPAKPDDKPTTPDDDPDKPTTPDEKPTTPDQPTTPDEPEEPEVKKSGITLPDPNDYGVAAKDADGKEISAAAKGDKVYLTYDDSTLPEDKMFDAWNVTGKNDTAVEVKQDENGKYYFEMPEGDVTITLKLKPINETPDTPADSTFDTVAAVAGGVTAGAAIGVAGYYAGTGLYLDAIFGYVPANRQALATALWTKANKPEPQSSVLYTDVSEDNTDAQKADRWCVEQGLLSDKGDDTFKPGAYVTRVQCIKSWKALEKLLNNN